MKEALEAERQAQGEKRLFKKKFKATKTKIPKKQSTRKKQRAGTKRKTPDDFSLQEDIYPRLLSFIWYT